MIVGAGAAGVACADILLAQGVGDVIVCDRHGALCAGRRDDLDADARRARRAHQPEQRARDGERAARRRRRASSAVSGPGAVTADAVRTMAPDAIVFAMANPVPEVQPEEVRDDVAIMATGRSDYPNQINNVLAFPGVFRGALDVRARTINEEMKIAAAQAIAGVIPDDELHADYIVPSVFNRGVARGGGRGGRDGRGRDRRRAPQARRDRRADDAAGGAAMSATGRGSRR